MGIYNGTIAYTRFRILGTEGGQTISRLNALLEPFKAPTLKIESTTKPESIGWVRPLTTQEAETLGENDHWDISDCQTSGGLLLRVRYERRKVPTSLIQMIFRQRLVSHTKSTGKGPTRPERQKIKDEVMTELLRRSLPEIQFIDVLWRDSDSELYIFSSSRRMTDKILQLFNQTFADDLDLSVIKLNPAAAWLETENSDSRFKNFVKTSPTVFARQGV